ncbi:hypothetical protein BBJ28_00007138 [Nothophytophthora sp. Chile5]|nr:hypothetical protein BBJ28_00007138 [Nothophytophthora sp. Chile5]
MGYNVAFPSGKKPFPAQLAVMNKVLMALKTGQHALLESPTGSGKTLALLCSSLTFQKQWVQSQVAANEELERQKMKLEAEKKKAAVTTDSNVGNEETAETAASAAGDDDGEDAYFCTQPSLDKFKHGWISMADKKAKKRSREDAKADDAVEPADATETKKKRVLPASFGHAAEDAGQSQPAKTPGENPPAKARVAPPRIYFCSRTHSQLAQVVDELKSCPTSYLESPEAGNAYATQLQTCVLGSKRNYCVNPKVSRDATQVDENCRLALEGKSCSYFRKRKRVNDLRRVAPAVWDIEDLVALAKKHRECAYFHSREALDHANIVFCPYNYLLDPSIRAAVGINLKNAIIVLDEAHNVEDTCRSSASVELTTDVLAAAIKAFSVVIKHGSRPTTYNMLLKLLNGINRWLQGVNSNSRAILQPSGFEEESKVWDGADALAMLAEYSGLTRDNVGAMKECVKAVREYENELSNNGEQSQQQQQSAPKESDAAANPSGASVLLGSLALGTVESIMNVVDYMFRDESKYLDDFKLVVIKSRPLWRGGGRFQSPNKSSNGNQWQLKMCLWCLNAAVAFSDIVRQARSVILTSGTLSPMDSFAGELGTEFPIRLEANHVVNMRKQVFIGSIMNGPGYVDLSSTYKNQQEFKYQDSMGQLLLQYSQVIPGGVLMFFPSYSLLNKLSTRWKQTGLWDQMEKFKTVFTEPRNAGKDFDALLDEYKSTIANLSGNLPAGPGKATENAEKTGAIFLAVYRGKVSEGIDFSNDNARAVLCVGIPFPNVKELQVSLKRKYQDQKSRMDTKLVNGHVWYQLQAFRALNQALGRCIRHRQDYGAILLLDSRHRFNAHTKSLSKWMRPFIQEFEHSQQCTPLFGEFFARNRLEFPHVVAAPAVSAPLMVLKYEVDAKGKNSKAKAKAKRTTAPTLSSTMASVKEYMAKQKQEADGSDPAPVFSIFQHQAAPKKP